MMRKKRILKHLLASVLSGAMLVQTASFMPVPVADAAGACTINTNKTYQMIRGFGGMNLPEWMGSDMTSAQVQKAFGNGADEMGLTVLRIYVSDDSNSWSRAVPTAKAAQSLGATVFATPWNPPAAIRNTVNGGNSGGKYQLKKDKWAEYAQHLNSYVKYMEGQGVNLYSVSIQNEPDYAADWTYWSANDLASFAAQYGKAVTNGTNAKLMSPESFQYRKDIYNAILNNQQAKNNIDLFGTHFYGTQRNQMDFSALENSGKDIWMTEVYVPDSNSDADTWPQAIQVAENIHNGLVVGNMNAYVWWYIRRSYGPMKENGNISKRGYMMAQYSKWVRPGDVRIDATEQPNNNILVSAYKHSDKQITVVAVNKGSSEVSQQFSVDGRTITNVDRYRTTGSENIARTQNMEHETSSYWASLPGNSVSTFVISLESDGVAVPENPNQPVVAEPEQPDENGYYFHDTFENGSCSWEGRGSASASTGSDAYAGSKGLAVTGRESAWNGAQKTLNSATFEAGKEYSFSVVAKSASSQNVMLSMQYTDSAGDTQYAHIANGVSEGGFVLLSNPNFKIPAGASSLILYVETETGTGDLTIDEAIGAVAGTAVTGPKQTVFTRGDVNSDGVINAADVSLAKQVVSGKLTDSTAKRAADADQSGTADADDVKLIRDFVLGKIKEFPVAERPVPEVDFSEMERKFGSVNLARSYKKDDEHNPLISQYFGADPGVMEYDGRVYIYMTDDHLLYNGNSIKDIEYSTINCLRCISSDDLVNWTDHGLINAAGNNGICKWGGNSWAPTACHKKINGKEKFFLYFANGGNGIAVMTADSPIGPWSDPIGKALISRQTPNCGNVEWLFDPAVLVDDDGKAYLYFGGGVPQGQNAHPKTARAVQLGDDMTSIVGTPVSIDPPYLFEDSGIHKHNGKYYYSYCTNFNTGGNQYGLTSGAIDYMVSDSPLGPFTYKGEVFKGIGTFFGTGGNNHHTIMQFKGQYYLFYHAQYLQDSMGIKGGYRSTHIDKLTVNADGSMQQVTGTKKGISQIKTLDPTGEVRAATLSHQGGIEIEGRGNTTVKADKGDWFRVSGVECASVSAITVKASSQSGSIIKVCKGSASGDVVSYIEIPAGSSMQEITSPVKDCSGTVDLYFVFNNTTSVDSWKMS